MKFFSSQEFYDDLIKNERYYDDDLVCSRKVFLSGYQLMNHLNGNIMYDGYMVDGFFHGKGVLYDENEKIIYSGEFFHGNRKSFN